MNGSLRLTVLTLALSALAGCLTAPASIREREAHWRDVLSEEAPAGSSRADVVAMFQRHGLDPSVGTYRTVAEDGAETSNCRLPRTALMAFERGAVRGLYLNWDVEVTVCFDASDHVESHYVGTWNRGV